MFDGVLWFIAIIGGAYLISFPFRWRAMRGEKRILAAWRERRAAEDYLLNHVSRDKRLRSATKYLEKYDVEADT